MEPKKLDTKCTFIVCLILVLINFDVSFCTKIPSDPSTLNPNNYKREVKQTDDLEDTKNVEILLDENMRNNYRQMTSEFIIMKEYQNAKNYVIKYFNNNREIERIVNQVFLNNSHPQVRHYHTVLDFADNFHSNEIGPQNISLKLFIYESLNTEELIAKDFYIERKMILLNGYKRFLECVECTSETKQIAQDRIEKIKNEVFYFALNQLTNVNVHRLVEATWFSKLYKGDKELTRELIKRVISEMYSENNLHNVLNKTSNNFEEIPHVHIDSKPGVSNILSKINNYPEKITQILGYMFLFDKLKNELEPNSEELLQYAATYKMFADSVKPSYYERKIIGLDNLNELITEMKSYISHATNV